VRHRVEIESICKRAFPLSLEQHKDSIRSTSYSHGGLSVKSGLERKMVFLGIEQCISTGSEAHGRQDRTAFHTLGSPVRIFRIAHRGGSFGCSALHE
ncbi:unnamed protein product, partial [Nesidiocoris tenuis]